MNDNRDIAGNRLFSSSSPLVRIPPRTILVLLLVLAFAWRALFIYRDLSWLSNYWLFEDFGYCLKIAKNIALGLGETFDGVVPTNGYQPLYVWLLVPVFWIFKTDLVMPVYVAATLLALANVATGWAVHSILKRMTGNAPLALLGAAFWLFNFAIAKDGSNGLEAGLSVMLAAFTIDYYLSIDAERATSAHAFKLGILLGLSFLGRVDAVFLAAAVGATTLLWGPGSLSERIRFLAITVFAFLLLAAPYALWNIVHFGSPLPTSGQVTSGKSSLFALAGMSLEQIGTNLRYGLYIIWRVLSGTPTYNGWVAPPGAGDSGALFVVLSLVFCFIVLASHWASYGRRVRQALFFLILAGALYLYGYTIHTFVAFERYFLPVVLVLAVLYAVCLHSLFLKRADRINTGLGWAFGLAMVVLPMLGAAPFLKGELPPAFGWRDGSQALNRIAAPGDTVAALQTGNLGYFYTQGRAVNLDGVVNMDAYRARQAGKLDLYIADQKVKYLADEGGWVFNVANFIGDPERRASFLAGLKLVHKSPDYLFNIYEVGTASYGALRKLDEQPSWSKRSHDDMTGGSALLGAGAGARLAFASSHCFDLKFLRHDWSGIARVFRDGALLREIDLYSPVQDPTYRVFFDQDDTPHDYVIEVSDKRNPASRGNEVWFDAVMERTHCQAGRK